MKSVQLIGNSFISQFSTLVRLIIIFPKTEFPKTLFALLVFEYLEPIITNQKYAISK